MNFLVMLGKKQIMGKKHEWFSWYLDKKAKVKQIWILHDIQIRLTLSKTVSILFLTLCPRYPSRTELSPGSRHLWVPGHRQNCYFRFLLTKSFLSWLPFFNGKGSQTTLSCFSQGFIYPNLFLLSSWKTPWYLIKNSWGRTKY